MNVIRSTTLAIPSSLMPTAVLVIDYCDRANDLEITSIELYGDKADTSDMTKLLGDFSIEQLTRDTQELICAAVTVHSDNQRRERGARRLWSDLRSLQQESNA